MSSTGQKRLTMKNLCFIAFMWLMLLSTNQAISGPKKSQIEMWDTGFMHAAEVKGKTGQQWFGLYETKSGFELRKSRITVIDTSDELHDRYVAVDQATLPTFLFRGIESMKSGPVHTVFFGKLSFVPSNHLILDKWDTTYCALSSSGKMEGNLVRNFEIFFHNSRVKQSLVKYKTITTDVGFTLMWAGDLDGDGKLDFIIDLATHYNMTEPTLFLSSKAGPTELVKKVVSFYHVGC